MVTRRPKRKSFDDGVRACHLFNSRYKIGDTILCEDEKLARYVGVVAAAPRILGSVPVVDLEGDDDCPCPLEWVICRAGYDSGLDAARYRWIRENGCILLPNIAGDDMPTARILEALDDKVDELRKDEP